MTLEIDANRTLSDIKSQFNKEFPYLKLEFFSKKHEKFEATEKSHLLKDNVKLTELSVGSCKLEITKDMSVEQLETLFQQKCKLNVQVFRKSGKIWLESTVTDNWSLEKQNTHGKELDVLNTYDKK